MWGTNINEKLGMSVGAIQKYLECSRCEQSILEKIDSSALALSKAVEISKLSNNRVWFTGEVIVNRWTAEKVKKISYSVN